MERPREAYRDARLTIGHRRGWNTLNPGHRNLSRFTYSLTRSLRTHALHGRMEKRTHVGDDVDDDNDNEEEDEDNTD